MHTTDQRAPTHNSWSLGLCVLGSHTHACHYVVRAQMLRLGAPRKDNTPGLSCESHKLCTTRQMRTNNILMCRGVSTPMASIVFRVEVRSVGVCVPPNLIATNYTIRQRKELKRREANTTVHRSISLSDS